MCCYIFMCLHFLSFRSIIFFASFSLFLCARNKLIKVIFSLSRRPLSKNYKSSHCSESASQYFRGGRAPRSHYSPSSNMEFLRGVYAFMQVSRSSVSVNFFQFTNQLTSLLSFFLFIKRIGWNIIKEKFKLEAKKLVWSTKDKILNKKILSCFETIFF